MNAVVSSALARMVSFLPTAVATLLTTRLVVDRYGLAAFAGFALILSLINLIPLNNLGVGAAVTSAYASGGVGMEYAERTLLTAARVLTLSTIATALVATAIGAAGLWPALLGDSSGPNAWVALALGIYALTFVPGLGQSMLLGVHRNHITVIVQTFFNPLILVLVGAAVFFDAGGAAVIVAPSVALLIVNSVTGLIAGRAVRTSWRRMLRRLLDRRRYPGASIRAMSGPVLLITLSTPIALQSDRIVLSHVSSTHAVADYSVAMQIFAPALALIAASAQPLWPVWAQARSRGRRGPDITRVVGGFSLAALLLGTALALVADPAATLIGGSRIHVDPLLAAAGALMVVTAAASHPVAMSLMDPVGVRFVLWCTGLALPANISLSVVLGHRLGAPGPLLATVVVGLFLQTLPGLVYSRDRQSAGRHRRPRRASTPSPAVITQRLESAAAAASAPAGTG